MNRELLKRALYALQGSRTLYEQALHEANFCNIKVGPGEIEQEIETYLAQPDEPVAWMIENHPANDTFTNFTPNFNIHFERLGCKVTPLYTSTPTNRRGLLSWKKITI